MEQQTGSKLGKEYVKAVYCHLAYLTSMQSTSAKCQAGWITSWNQDCWKKYQQPQICRWHHSNGRKQTKEPLDEDERGEWKSWLKINIQKTKIMASGPITSWQIEREKVGTVTDFIFLASKITVDGDCNHKIKRRLLLGRKSYDNLGSILKSRDITLPANIHLVKALVFPVVMYKFETWTIMKAECWRIDAFTLWYLRRFLRVPWTARRSNQSILK